MEEAREGNETAGEKEKDAKHGEKTERDRDTEKGRGEKESAEEAGRGIAGDENGKYARSGEQGKRERRYISSEAITNAIWSGISTSQRMGEWKTANAPKHGVCVA